MSGRTKFLRLHGVGLDLAQVDQPDASPIARENTRRLIQLEPELASTLLVMSELARRQAQELLELADHVDDLYASLAHPGRRP